MLTQALSYVISRRANKCERVRQRNIYAHIRACTTIAKCLTLYCCPRRDFGIPVGKSIITYVYTSALEMANGIVYFAY